MHIYHYVLAAVQRSKLYFCRLYFCKQIILSANCISANHISANYISADYIYFCKSFFCKLFFCKSYFCSIENFDTYIYIAGPATHSLLHQQAMHMHHAHDVALSGSLHACSLMRCMPALRVSGLLTAVLSQQLPNLKFVPDTYRQYLADDAAYILAGHITMRPYGKITMSPFMRSASTPHLLPILQHARMPVVGDSRCSIVSPFGVRNVNVLSEMGIRRS